MNSNEEFIIDLLMQILEELRKSNEIYEEQLTIMHDEARFK